METKNYWRWLIINSTALCLIFFSLCIYFWRAKMSGHFYGETDFFKFYQSIRFYFANQNLYSPTIIEVQKKGLTTWLTADGNLNPPFLTLLLLPLYSLNYADALYVWTLCSTLFFLLSAWLVLKPYPHYQKYTLPIIAAFLIYAPNSVTLAYGQISAYIIFLITSAWLLARKQHDISAGIFIGVACAIKLFCGLFLIYFFVIKRFRLLVSSIISGGIAFGISLAVFGWDNYLRYHLTLKKIGWYSASWNVSFLGFFTRLFSNTEKNIPLINLPHMVPILTIMACAVLLLYLRYAWQNVNFDKGFSLTLISMLLLSPLGWSYYFGLLIIPYLVLIHEKKNDAVHLTACALLFFSTLLGDLLRTPDIKSMAQVFYNGGIGFYILMILLILLVNKVKENKMISENLWIVIYVVIFLPSLASLGYITKNLIMIKTL